jgi:hypothetical protein
MAPAGPIRMDGAETLHSDYYPSIARHRRPGAVRPARITPRQRVPRKRRAHWAHKDALTPELRPRPQLQNRRSAWLESVPGRPRMFRPPPTLLCPRGAVGGALQALGNPSGRACGRLRSGAERARRSPDQRGLEGSADRPVGVAVAGSSAPTNRPSLVLGRTCPERAGDAGGSWSDVGSICDRFAGRRRRACLGGRDADRRRLDSPTPTPSARAHGTPVPIPAALSGRRG